MRYSSVPNVVFQHRPGMYVTVKDTYDVPEYPSVVMLPVTRNSELDEIATRDIVYGEDGEDQTYRLFEANIEDIIEGDMSLERITQLRVPA